MSARTLDRKKAEPIANGLNRYLASTYLLLLKTQNFHWNITGEHFYSYHNLLEDQYKDLQDAVDELAERVRKVGFLALGSFSQFSKVADIKESTKPCKSREMLTSLLSDHQTMADLAKDLIKLFQSKGDEASADLLVSRLHAHDKAIWMLSATLS